MTVNVCERLAILTAGTTWRGEATARATGSSLTQAEVSYLIAGLPPIQEALILAKYCGHPDAMLRAQTLVVVHQTMARRWLRSRGKTLDARPNWYANKFYLRVDALVSVAVAEILDTETCKRCNGEKVKVLGNGEIMHCPACNGKGVRDKSASKRARGCGVDPANWVREGWAAMYGELLAFMYACEDEAARKIKGRLR